MNATIPFSILEMLIAHQTPVMPSPIAVNPIAHWDTKAVERDADDGGWERAARTVE